MPPWHVDRTVGIQAYENDTSLSDEEIETMQKDAESHAAEDEQRRKLAEAKNKASSLVYSTEKLMKEHADKLDDASKSAIEASIAKVNEAEKGDDVAAIETAFAELEQATHALSKHMYESKAEKPATQGDEEAAESKSAGKEDENVIDAEFEKTE